MDQGEPDVLLANQQDTVIESGVITNVDHGKRICEHLGRENVISVDCYGRDLLADPPAGKISVIAIGVFDQKFFIFDLHVCPNLMKKGGLETLLCTKAIVKVVYDGQRIFYALSKCFNVRLENVYDVHCGHAFATHIEQEAIDYRRVPLESRTLLCHLYGHPVVNTFKVSVHRRFHADNDLWDIRPFENDMVGFIESEVLAFVPKVYTELQQLLPGHFKQELAAFTYNYIRQLIDQAMLRMMQLELNISDYQEKLLEAQIQYKLFSAFLKTTEKKGKNEATTKQKEDTKEKEGDVEEHQNIFKNNAEKFEMLEPYLADDGDNEDDNEEDDDDDGGGNEDQIENETESNAMEETRSETEDIESK